ncbi:MAG: N-acetylglucosamine-6-phosphate deacetylase [Clostridia bacterium]|nr:N-acetylglucosamine-6-phosphate deacetylase [Clostridia bacterium]
MIFKNAVLCNAEFQWQQTDLTIEDDRIAAVGPTDAPGEDFSGCRILPGMIDLHIHGCAGADVSCGDPQAVEAVSRRLAACGVTSFCPTTMTLPEETLAQSLRSIAAVMGKEPGAYIHGVNLEGPFLSPEKKGAQAAEDLQPPSAALVRRLHAICPIRLVALAPELPGARDFLREIAAEFPVSVAHTAADGACVRQALADGACHATHLFNAMTGLDTREPGAVGAILDSNATAELICDGVHICDTTLRLAFRLLGSDRAVVISDAMMAAGLPDGVYTLGGQTVYSKDGAARLADGTLAGSVSDLFSEFRHLCAIGIPVMQAIRACTINPARVIGAEQTTGSLAPGKTADLLVLSEDLQSIRGVFVRGRRII